jgi:hypothetical protein
MSDGSRARQRQQRTRTPRCSQCQAVLSDAKLVVEGRWLCPDCTYEREHGLAPRLPRARSRRGQPQQEQLFSPDSLDSA